MQTHYDANDDHQLLLEPHLDDPRINDLPATGEVVPDKPF